MGLICQSGSNPLIQLNSWQESKYMFPQRSNYSWKLYLTVWRDGKSFRTISERFFYAFCGHTHSHTLSHVWIECFLSAHLQQGLCHHITHHITHINSLYMGFFITNNNLTQSTRNIYLLYHKWYTLVMFVQFFSTILSNEFY